MTSADSQLYALKSEANTLASQITSLTSQHATAKANKKTYKTRLSELKQVKSNLTRSFDSTVSSINKHRKKLKSALASATDGLSHESDLTSAVEGDAEAAVEDDRYGSQVYSNVVSEIDSVQEKVDSSAETIYSLASQANSKIDRIKTIRKEMKELMESEECTVSVTLPSTSYSKLSYY